MSKKYFIEGHKPKTKFEDEETLLIDNAAAYKSLKEATSKALEYFDKQEELGMAVIYEVDKNGNREGIKFVHRDDEGNIQEILSWW